MQTATAEIPASSRVATSSMGLGWTLGEHKATGLRYVSHSGGTNGQCAHLRIFPEHQVCFAVLLNRSKVDALTAVIERMTEIATGVRPVGAVDKVDVSLSEEALKACVGQYHSYAGDYSISLGADGLLGTFDDAVDEEERLAFRLEAVGDGCFEMKYAQGGSAGLVYFTKPDEAGQFRRFFAGVRLYQR